MDESLRPVSVCVVGSDGAIELERSVPCEVAGVATCPKGAVADKIKHQDRIVALRGNDLSIRKIADLVGVSPSTFQKALRRADGRYIVLTVT